MNRVSFNTRKIGVDIEMLIYSFKMKNTYKNWNMHAVVSVVFSLCSPATWKCINHAAFCCKTFSSMFIEHLKFPQILCSLLCINSFSLENKQMWKLRPKNIRVFTPCSLMEELAKLGFTIRQVAREPVISSSSILYFLELWDSLRNRKPNGMCFSTEVEQAQS